MSFHGVHITWEVIAPIITTIIAIAKWLKARGEQPKPIQWVINAITEDSVLAIIGNANKFTELDDVGKHTWASAELSKLIKERLHLDIPTAWSNIIVDAVFSKFYGSKTAVKV